MIPKIMAILNTSPDSFSEDETKNKQSVVDHIHTLAQSECEIIDIGGQSSKPNAQQISIQEEIDRLGPALEYLNKNKLFRDISIDTTRSEIVRQSIEICPFISIINDISGGRFDPRIIQETIKNSCSFIATHSQGTWLDLHANYRYHNISDQVKTWALDQIQELKKLGLNDKKIIIDPGIGFSKKNKQNIDILKNLKELSAIECPILISLSRKNFIGHITSEPIPKKRDPASNLFNFWAMTQGVSIIRTHDPKGLNVARKIYLSLI